MVMLLGLIGTALSVAGSISQGQAAKAQANYSAKLKEKEGTQQYAIAQRKAIERQREGKLAESRALAVAAASGAGGVGTPTVNATLENIYAQAGLNARSEKFTGEAARDGNFDQATLLRMQGKSAYQNSLLQGFASGISGGAKAMYG